MALWFWTRRKVEDRPALFGFLLSIVALARLDHVFIAIALFALAAFRLLSNRRRTLELALGFVVPLLIYLIVNRVFFGSALPVSGKLKSTAPQINVENFEALAAVFNS
jgi:hypothetical protein